MSVNPEVVKQAADAITWGNHPEDMGHVDWPDKWDAVEIAAAVLEVAKDALAKGVEL